MLTHLQIKDFTLIDNLNHELATGMTVLTGETGAGKSIIIDALSLILGERGNSQLIRQGSNRCDISGTFDISALTHIRHWLLDNELESEGECIVRRTIDSSGRSRCYINGQVVPLHKLKDLCSQLIHIHGQHDNHALLKPEIQRHMVDAFAGTQDLLKKVKDTYYLWHKTHEHLRALEEKRRTSGDKADILSYQLKELEDLHLQDDEIAKLHDEHRQLHHAQDYYAAGVNALSVLTEGDHNVSDQIQKSISPLLEFSGKDSNVKQIIDMLQSALIQVQEATSDIEHFISANDFEPNRLATIDKRLHVIHQIARKHKIEPEAIPHLMLTISKELALLHDLDHLIEQAEKSLQQIEQSYNEIAKNLSAARTQAAKQLSTLVSEKMKLLGMAQGQFLISLKPLTTPSPFGLEQIEMHVTTNPGMPLGPLNKVASGGEISRICLSLQVIIAECYQTPVLIFDEVDVGIGGGIAEIVGKLLRTLGAKTQVLCITHLAQVAACAHHHLQVAKTTDGRITQSKITTLNQTQRVEEIARMLGGMAITPKTLAHAREMLQGVEAAAEMSL